LSCRIVIADENGERLKTVLFSDALTVTGLPMLVLATTFVLTDGKARPFCFNSTGSNRLSRPVWLHGR
jgi:hypothetical protein